MNSKTFTVRAAAILTSSEVAGTTFANTLSYNGMVSVYIQLTIGSLDAATFYFYVSRDNGTTWVPLRLSDGTTSVSFSEDTNIAIPVNVNGWTTMKVGTLGEGTATSSTATVQAVYQTSP